MRRPLILLALVLVAIVSAMAAKSALVQPPAVRTTYSPERFEAFRAKAMLTAILGDQRPHPADTDADDHVRSRLVAQLQQMGLKPIVRDQFACNELYKQRGVACARVRNVLAILGPATGKALLLNAHYDSMPAGPGASDDGMGVATLLGVAEAMKGQSLRRPVILLFNEGEELGLVGARAFLNDPLSRQVDSLINLEARGVTGPVNMFETSRPNAAPIRLYGATVKHPVANSLSTDVYRTMPNYTDVNTFASLGWLTLNLAPIGNETRYHSAGDDLAAQDPATLQHMGDQVLALTKALANGTPEQHGGDRIFMDVAGWALISLPLIVGGVLLAVVMLALGGLVVRRGGFVRGSAVVVGTLVASTALSWVALALIGGVRHGMFWRAHALWTNLGCYASVMLVAVVLLSTFGHGLRVGQLRPLFWLFVLAIGALIGLIAPGGIIFFLFPPLIALVGMIASRWWKPLAEIGGWLAILFFYLTWGAMLALLEELLNGGPMWLFAPLGSLLVLPVLIEAKPLIDRTSARAAAGLAAILALAAWAMAAASPAYSADRQQRFVIQHVTDLQHMKAWWSVLNDAAPLPKAFGSRWTRGKLPFSDRPRWIDEAPADASFAAAPGVLRLSQVRNGNERTLTLRLLSTGFNRIELIAPADARVRAAGLPGAVRPIDQTENGKYFIDCDGRSCDGFTLQLVIGQPKPVEFVVLGGRASLPPSAAPLLAARPKYARPQYNPDETILFSHVSL
jgi:Peptidase family M28